MSDEPRFREVYRRERGAAHGRPKVICDSPGVACDVCCIVGRCLGFDSSDEEYGPFWICAECFGNALNGERL